MTGLLKDTLTERAAAVAEPPLDLDAIIATGNTRIRRRHATAVAAVAFVSVLVIAGGVLTAKNLLSADEPPVSGVPTFKERRPTYATGDKIHYGKDVIEVGPEKISSFIQVDIGFVYVTRGGVVYFTDGSGNGRSDAKIGTGSSGRVTADDSGTLVGWVDERGAEPDQFVLYDVATRHEVARTSAGNEKPPSDESRSTELLAIDNDVAYLGALDGIHRWDIADGKDTMLKAGALPSELSDAANGRLAYPVVQDGGVVEGIAVDRTLGSRKVVVDDTDANLSPDAAYVFTESGDTSHLYRSDGSGQIKLKSDYALLVQGVWLDNDRIVALGIKSLDNPEKNPLDLVTCSAKTATCTPTVKAFAPYPPEDVPATFQVATGHRLD